MLIVAGLYLVVWGKSEESKYGKEKVAIPSLFENNPTKSFLIQPLLHCTSENGDI
jgi:hypothetical protein